MLDHEKKLNILDISIVCILFTIGCFVGKMVMENVGGKWIAFNGPALGILILGELIWWRIRKVINEKWEKNTHKGDYIEN